MWICEKSGKEGLRTRRENKSGWVEPGERQRLREGCGVVDHRAMMVQEREWNERGRGRVWPAGSLVDPAPSSVRCDVWDNGGIVNCVMVYCCDQLIGLRQALLSKGTSLSTRPNILIKYIKWTDDPPMLSSTWLTSRLTPASTPVCTVPSLFQFAKRILCPPLLLISILFSFFFLPFSRVISR